MDVKKFIRLRWYPCFRTKLCKIDLSSSLITRARFLWFQLCSTLICLGFSAFELHHMHQIEPKIWYCKYGADLIFSFTSLKALIFLSFHLKIIPFLLGRVKVTQEHKLKKMCKLWTILTPWDEMLAYILAGSLWTPCFKEVCLRNVLFIDPLCTNKQSIFMELSENHRWMKPVIIFIRRVHYDVIEAISTKWQEHL